MADTPEEVLSKLRAARARRAAAQERARTLHAQYMVAQQDADTANTEVKQLESQLVHATQMESAS